MFDFDVGKLLIFGIVALVVIPPKDLPRVMRAAGQIMAKMRRMAAEFQSQFMEAMREAELDSVKAELDSVKKELVELERSAKIDAAVDPAMAMRQEIVRAVEPPKEIGVSAVALTDAAQAGGAPAGEPPAPAADAKPAPTAGPHEIVESPAAPAVARDAAE